MIVDIGTRRLRTIGLRPCGRPSGLRRRQRRCGLPTADPGRGLRLRPGHAGALRLPQARQARQWGRAPLPESSLEALPESAAPHQFIARFLPDVQPPGHESPTETACTFAQGARPESRTDLATRWAHHAARPSATREPGRQSEPDIEVFVVAFSAGNPPTTALASAFASVNPTLRRPSPPAA